MALGISLLGCGHPHVPDVLGVIASEPDLHLAAAWDADPSVVPGEISSHAVGDAERAITRADAVVICAPTDQRPDLCVRAARAGRPILVEKPVATTADQAKALAREVGRSRTPALAALFLRELPALQRLGGVLRAGLLGRLAGASASFVHAGALDGSLARRAAWMLDHRRAGVGGLGDLAIHLVDAFALLGALPILGAVRLDRGRAGTTDVGGVAIGSWADTSLTLHASWVTRPAGLEIVLSGGSASATVRDGTLELHAENGVAERWVGAPPDAGEAVRAFARSLRARRFQRDGLLHAIRAQEALERAAVLS